LAKLADAVSVPVASVFVSDNATPQFVGAADRQVLQFGDPDAPNGIRKLIQFMSSPNGGLELVQLEIPVGYTAGDEQHAHEGEEVMVVTKGKVIAVHDNEKYELAVGDSLHWTAAEPHMIQNGGDVPAVLMIARTPPGFMDLRFDEQAPGTVVQ
jgi:mannose-6-phosphate isomerase-like protein (cupin superfamily)